MPRKTYKKKRRTAGLATRPKFVPRKLATKRWHGVDTKIFYFKRNATALADGDGVYYNSFRARELTDNPADYPQFTLLKSIYDQYKVLAIQVKFYPANVGIEPHDTLLLTDYTLLRGQTVVWNDQRTDNTVVPTQISQVINNASMHMCNSRRPFKRTIYRAKGFPEWGAIQPPATDDSWGGSIQVLTTGATAASITPPVTAPLLWYFTVSYKVIFRSRRTE